MKATNEKKSEGYSSPYDFEGRIPLSQAIPLGLQHVMAMFIGNLTPLIIVMGVCGHDRKMQDLANFVRHCSRMQ